MPSVQPTWVQSQQTSPPLPSRARMKHTRRRLRSVALCHRSTALRTISLPAKILAFLIAASPPAPSQRTHPLSLPQRIHNLPPLSLTPAPGITAGRGPACTLRCHACRSPRQQAARPTAHAPGSSRPRARRRGQAPSLALALGLARRVLCRVARMWVCVCAWIRVCVCVCVCVCARARARAFA